MLDIQGIDIGKVLNTSSIGGGSAISGGEASGVDLGALLSFSTDNEKLSEEEMSKLENEYVSAQSNIQSGSNTGEASKNDGKESERDANLNLIKTLEDTVKNLIAETQSLIGSFLQQPNEGENSGIQIGKNNPENEQKVDFNLSNGSAQHQEAVNKQEDANAKVEELGALVKETDLLEKQMCASAPNQQEDTATTLQPVSEAKEQSSNGNSNSNNGGSEKSQSIPMEEPKANKKSPSKDQPLQTESDKSSINQHKKLFQMLSGKVMENNAEINSGAINMSSPFQAQNQPIKQEEKPLFFGIEE